MYLFQIAHLHALATLTPSQKFTRRMMVSLQSLHYILINSSHTLSSPPLALTSHSIWLWRYGAAAGQATDHAVNSAINVGITAFNVDNLGIKAVVKRTGRHTAQALLEDYKIQKKPENGTQVEKLEK